MCSSVNYRVVHYILSAYLFYDCWFVHFDCTYAYILIYFKYTYIYCVWRGFSFVFFSSSRVYRCTLREGIHKVITHLVCVYMFVIEVILYLTY